jgi:hypothetical protein
MHQTVRDSAIGQLIRLAIGRPFPPYPEENDKFEIPASFRQRKAADHTRMARPYTPNDNNEAHGERENFRHQITPSIFDIADDAVTVVIRYSDDDPENTHNWSFTRSYSSVS